MQSIKKKTIYLIVIAVAVLLILLIFPLKKFTGKTINSEELLLLPVSKITGDATFYEYNFNGVNIRYFAVKAEDGSIKTAFDECDVCFRSKKGYRQEGNFMVCNNCGNRYPISGLGTENKAGGGCWPGYLPSELIEDNLAIKISDLNKGVRLFK
jgi:uncharacterized membrane protein